MVTGYSILHSKGHGNSTHVVLEYLTQERSMEDIIQQSGGTFGTNEVMILSQLSLAAIPTSAIIFLDLVVDRPPTVGSV